MTSALRWLRQSRILRTCLACLVLLLGVAFTAVAIHKLLLPLLGLLFPSLQPRLYDLAVYGRVPTRAYYSSDLRSPDISVLKWDPMCDDGSLILLGLFGDWIDNPGPVILDAHGNLIWKTLDYGVIANVQIQEHQGERFLTFWAGEKEGSKGKGVMYMLDSKYKVARTLEAVGEGLYSDLHEFQITKQGTALLTVYNDTAADLSEFGMFRDENGWIADCILQEIDIETNELLFQWVASEHVRLAKTRYVQVGGGYSEDYPFDFFHMNSIEKDSRGNYLISSRHFHTITYIEGGTGNILWTIGADSTDFVDVSEVRGAATDFCWSHHARWFDEEAGIISLFNNGAAGPLHLDRPTSSGMLIQVDEKRATVRHVQDFNPLYNVRSHSQGSLQRLPEKDTVFIGWGSSAMWSEHDVNGTTLCEAHFAPSLFYFWEYVKSYRAFKVWDWKGDPQWPPSAKIYGNKLYVSWNGATEVASWRVERRKDDQTDDAAFETFSTVEKDGFETALDIIQETSCQYRVAALNSTGGVLGYSGLVVREEQVDPLPEILGALFGLLLVVGLLFAMRHLLRKSPFAMALPWARPSLWPEFKYSKLSE